MDKHKEDIDKKKIKQEQKETRQDKIREKKIEDKKEEIKDELTSFSQSAKDFFKALLNIRAGTDKDATAESIRNNISMSGHTAWILVFSIFIASIGLNISSAAVVIGAMLISPLMGPILGIGFSVAINDIDTLRSSIINFAVVVILSILTSFLFFSIPIFQQETHEIIARTKPDVRDVLVAISGGLALIIAISRPSPQFNTVAGVAIATALMPPLCTAGFGLAIGNMSYFGGALFLFIINSIFIALASFAIIKYLRFPMVKYINQAKRKRISQIATFVASVIFIFSIYLFYQLFIENKYLTNASNFIESLKKEGVDIIGENENSVDYENKAIKLYVFGNEYSDSDITRWKNSLQDFGLEGTSLDIIQSHEDSKVRKDIDEIKNLYINSHKLISSRDETVLEKDRRIGELEKDLRHYYKDEIMVEGITKEIHINYQHLEKIAFSKKLISDFKTIDTVRVIYVKWDSEIKKDEIKKQETRLKNWIMARFELKSLELKEME